MAEKACTDHLSNSYSSVKKMCEAYGINYSTFKGRIKNGWSLETALSKKAVKLPSCVDPFGNKHKTVGAMCIAYGIGTDTLRTRLGLGWSLTKALTTPVRGRRKGCRQYETV